MVSLKLIIEIKCLGPKPKPNPHSGIFNTLEFYILTMGIAALIGRHRLNIIIQKYLFYVFQCL